MVTVLAVLACLVGILLVVIGVATLTTAYDWRDVVKALGIAFCGVIVYAGTVVLLDQRDDAQCRRAGGEVVNGACVKGAFEVIEP